MILLKSITIFSIYTDFKVSSILILIWKFKSISDSDTDTSLPFILIMDLNYLCY